MTDPEILTQFEGLIDDTLDQTLEIQLANTAKNRFEREQKLLIHQKERATQTTTAGQTYTTSYTLAADFRAWVNLYRGTTLLHPVPFAKRVSHRSSPDRFWTDHRQSKFYLAGTQGVAETLTETYIYKTDDISASTVSSAATTLTWPSEFHALLAYEMAKVYYAIDAGDKSRAWDDRWEAHYAILRKAFIDWDADLKLQEMDGSVLLDDSLQSENRIN